MMRQSLRLPSLIHLILMSCCFEKIYTASNSRLLIISLDGFAHDYLNAYSLPTINRIQNQGIKTKYGMQPTFVTMTFPNHISIATGMYEEDHGIVHNRFIDTKIQKFVTFGRGEIPLKDNRAFAIGTGDEGQWSDPKVEPIWITATKQNKKSAVLYWPAAHNVFHGIRPLFYTPVYSDLISLREKIDSAIEYFDQKSVQLVMLYHFEPDRQGHIYGPNSTETFEALVRVDSDLDYLLKKVRKELKDDLNIIVLSDHGMTDTTRLIQPFLEGYINKSMVEGNILDGSLFSVDPRPGQLDQVLDGLRRIPNVTVYTREQFPERYHYAKAVSRVGEVIVLPNEEGIVFSQATRIITTVKGNHGYDNTLPSMQAIFMAQGPDLNQHMEIDSLKNVDVYHIACRILSLEPNPYATAGSLENLTEIFRTRTNRCSQSLSSAFLMLVLLLFSLIM